MRGLDASASGAPTAVARAVEGILQLILSGGVLPGEQLRQDDMAARLRMSKVPIREALRVLETQGFIQHERYRGYFVARFSPADLEQFYLMRSLLEREIVSTIEPPRHAQVEELKALNQQIASTDSVAQQTAINRQFHFAVFELSPLHRLVAEVDRLWTLSESYRALYLAHDGIRDVVIEEHEAIVEALRAHDVDTLIRVHEEHRSRALQYILQMLAVRQAPSALRTHPD